MHIFGPRKSQERGGRVPYAPKDAPYEARTDYRHGRPGVDEMGEWTEKISCVHLGARCTGGMEPARLPVAWGWWDWVQNARPDMYFVPMHYTGHTLLVSAPRIWGAQS